MMLFTLCACLLTMFAAALLLYVSLATGLGPWIGPMLVVIIRFFAVQPRSVALLTISASFGGAIATGIGFSLTTIYFIDRATWDVWMSHPFLFCSGMFVLVVIAGSWGLGLAKRWAPQLIKSEDVSFPVTTAIGQTIDAPQGLREVSFFGAGVCLAGIVGFVRDILHIAAGLPLLPVCWASGFLAGTSLIMPTLVGLIGKYIIIEPLLMLTARLPVQYFGGLTRLDTTFALCSGLLLSGLLLSFPKDMLALWQRIRRTFSSRRSRSFSWSLPEAFGVIGALAICLAAGMPYGAIFFVLCAMVPLLEHLAGFAARTGLATYGRYMTIMMIPLLCMPGVSAMQIVLVCTIVGVVGATMVDSLCAYKLAQRYGIDGQSFQRAQWCGVLVTALAVGILFWLLCHFFVLGQMPLVAHRGISRALMMDTFHFNGFVVFFGVLLGWLLSWVGVNPAMVFGGLIMPSGLILSLVCGAGLRMLTRQTIQGTLFWSGVLAGDVFWIMFFLWYSFIL